MAQRMLGIDLGAHSVKVALGDLGFRSMRLLQLDTLPVPAGAGSQLERSLSALDQFEHPSEAIDLVALGVPGDEVLLRVFDIPFSDPRKAAAVVAGELADDIPWEMEDVVFDHWALPGGVHKVTVCAARSERVLGLIERLEAQGLDPRTLPPAPYAYDGLVRYAAPQGTVLLLDLGHRRTNVALVADGHLIMGRTLSRGGEQLTHALHEALQMSLTEAEALKEAEGLLYAGDPGDLGPRQQVVAQVTGEAMGPLIRDIRLTREIFEEQSGQKVERALLCGGTARLHGIASYLGQESQLGMPCAPLELEERKGFDLGGLGGEGLGVGAQSLGLALGLGSRGPLDLRQGEFAYRTDSSLFREKLVTLAVSTVLVLVFLALNAFSSLYALRGEEKALKGQLRQASRAVFGRPVMNPRTVSKRVKRGSHASGVGIPDKTAFDIFDMLSTRIPPRDKVKIDVTRLDIKTGKTFFTGTSDTRRAIGDLVQALEKIECFDKVTQGKVSQVAEGKKQFSLTINTKCF